MSSFNQSVILVILGIACVSIACFCHMNDVRETLLTIGGGLVGAGMRHIGDPLPKDPPPSQPVGPAK